jgi:uncharacterized cupredoxin-like copper-binding protein
MRLDPKAFGLAAGVAAVVLFVICAIAVALAPDATMAVGAVLYHADLSASPRTLTSGNVLGALNAWGVGTALVFWFTAALYNRLSSPDRA